MTNALVRLIWVIGQLCLLPVAPARYLHDLLGYLMVVLVYNNYVADVIIERRGYRLNWLVKWKPDAPHAKKVAVLLWPVLIGMGAFSICFPFWKAMWFTSLPGLSFWERAAVQFVAMQAVALPFPRIRDLPRWQAWWPHHDDEASEVTES